MNTPDINIAICRNHMTSLTPIIRKELPGARPYKDVSVMKAAGSSNRLQWFWELRLRDGSRCDLWVRGHNAYDARYNGWVQYLADCNIDLEDINYD